MEVEGKEKKIRLNKAKRRTTFIQKQAESEMQDWGQQES